MRSFWPAAEAAQVDYETLRDAVLAGEWPDSLAAGRFRRRGLAGLIAWPSADPIYMATLIGSDRPAWTPYVDPRLETLAGAYDLLMKVWNAGSQLIKERA